MPITKSYTRVFTYRAVGSRTSGGTTYPFEDKSSYTYNDSHSGSSNPKWREDVRAVRSATTPASGTRINLSWQAGSGSAKWRTSANPGSQYDRSWNCGVYIPNTHAFTTNCATPGAGAHAQSAENKAIAELYEQLTSFETSAPAGEDLGEISQTASMLRSPLKSLRTLVSATLDSHLHALRKPNRGSIIKALGDTAIEYQFGWKPIASSLGHAIVGLQGRDYLGSYHPFQANGKSAGVNQDPDSSYTMGTRSIKVHVVRRRIESLRYVGVWAVRVGVDRRSVNDVLALRWRDVVPTFWNLTPYSFLADYVTNLGTIAQSYSVPWTGVRWCVRTKRTVLTHLVTSGDFIDISPSWINHTGSMKPAKAERIVTTFQRSSMEVMPRPQFEIDFKLSPGQLFNTAALLLTKWPQIREKSQAVERQYPGIAGEFAKEARRRNMRVPYPFHRYPY